MLQIIKINFLKQACFVAAMVFSNGMANAATFTVINTADSGAGSMRQAMLDANANPGLDSIDFSIAGSCPNTIKPLTGLPGITDPVNINGYTQPGTAVATDISAATLCIEISGVSAPFGSHGLILATGSSGSSIRGLVINRFSRLGIFITATSPSNNVSGNYIGTDVTGTVPFGNFHGIQLNSLNNTVEDNLISGNANIGCLSIAGGDTWIEGNKVGTDVTGTVPLGNGVGLGLGTGHNTVISNAIAFNRGDGVNVVPGFLPAPFPVSNAILSNSIFGNGSLGIDLIAVRCGPPLFLCGLGQPQLNDAQDADEGFANNLQNFPVIDGKRSFLNPSLVQVWGSLDSKPSQDYLIQVFSSELADPSGYGEGQAQVGEITVTTDASGHANFHLPATNGVAVGSIITATATDLLTMDTSEFSKWENVDVKGSPTAYENAAGAAGGDGLGNMDWEPEIE